MKECCEKYLNEQFGGDPEIVKEIYGEYVASVRAKLQEAETELSEGKWAALDRVAHTIKGNALAVGDAAMSKTAIDLRHAANIGDHASAAALVESLKELSGLL